MALRCLNAFCPLVLVVSLALTSCANPAPNAGEPELPIITVGDVPLKMELALSRDEQQRGLMFREGIASDRGMLFVFSEPQEMSFWMKNVSFPIDIGYFTADGVLREIYPMYAHDTQSRKSKRDDLLYVLEVKSGWFSENGVRPGAKLDFDALSEALAKRR